MSYLLETMLRQPSSLPRELREKVQAAFPGQTILVYALCDLDHQLAYGHSWVMVTEQRLVLCLPEAGTWRTDSLELGELDRFEMQEGLSLTQLVALDAQGQVFHTFRYTRRQSRAMGNVQFAAEQKAKALKSLAKAVATGAGGGQVPGGAPGASSPAQAPAGVVAVVAGPATGPGPAASPGQATATSPVLPPADDEMVTGPVAADTEYREAMEKGLEESANLAGSKKLGILKRLLGLLVPYKRAMIAATIASVCMTLVSLIPPILSRVLIDDVLHPLEQDPATVAWGLLGSIILGMALIYLGQEALQFVRLRFMAVTGEKVAAGLRQQVYDHMQKLSLSYFSTHPTGSLIARVSSDTDRLWDFITFGFLDAIISILSIIGVAIALLSQDVTLGLVVLAPVPCMTFLFWLQGRRQHLNFHRIWRRWSAMTAVLSDVIPGMRVVKAFAREERESGRFREKNEAVLGEAVRLHREWTLFWPAVVMFIHVSNILIWVLGVPRVIEHIQSGGAHGLPLGVFIAFQGYVWMFWNPVQQLGQLSRTLNRVTSSAARVFEVLDTKPTITSKPDAWAPAELKGRVEFRNVSFTYDGIRNVLKGVDFVVEPGEMIGLVGPSGGGKTTMTNLICRFYDIKDGSILIDGVDVRDMELPVLRRHIGVVLQEPYLFHGTIAENIAYGADNPGLKDIIEAAKAANAHDFICGFPDGYETLVGERGQTLSGGERQRISIARAILHQPSILILDEATSSVDTETEKRIQEALHRLTAGRTTFAIAHRLSTLSAADRLFVMEGGRLVEQGTHAELLAMDQGVYAKLHRTQLEMQATIAV